MTKPRLEDFAEFIEGPGPEVLTTPERLWEEAEKNAEWFAGLPEATRERLKANLEGDAR